MPTVGIKEHTHKIDQTWKEPKKKETKGRKDNGVSFYGSKHQSEL